MVGSASVQVLTILGHKDAVQASSVCLQMCSIHSVGQCARQLAEQSKDSLQQLRCSSEGSRGSLFTDIYG